jgi:hypothetical protein
MAGVPENGKAIYSFLTNVGFTPNAAAGILGNIEQESGGNPEEQGGGLIQILGQAGGSLAEQLQATMQYIRANGSIADINEHASSPSAAALYFSTKYERPDAALANNANREQSAVLVAQAAKSGKWPAGNATVPQAGGGAGALSATGGLKVNDLDNPLGGLAQLGTSALGVVTGTASTVGDVATSIQGIGRAVNTAVRFLAVLGHPAFWLRVGAISAAIAMYFLGKSIGIKAPAVMPIPV